MLRLGSLCTGYGGLDLAAEAVLGPLEHTWYAEYDPAPTEAGTKGQPRLAPEFVEWLMGLPAGWVTDHLPRNGALKCLGNGVVPQQAAFAYTDLLTSAVPARRPA